MSLDTTRKYTIAEFLKEIGFYANNNVIFIYQGIQYKVIYNPTDFSIKIQIYKDNEENKTMYDTNISLPRLNTLHPKLRDEAIQIFEEIERNGVIPRCTYALRTFAEQEALYNQGRTTPGNIVTNAKAGYSFHNYGLACFDDQTRIITDKGFKYFYELDGTEQVLTFKNDVVEFQKPIVYISNDYDGEMIQIKSRSTNLLITPNHKMIVKRKTNGKWDENWTNILAENIDYKYKIPMSGEYLTTNIVKLPPFNSYYCKNLNIKDTISWWKFMGFYLSEGRSCGTSDNKKRTHNSRYVVGISQSYENNFEIWNEIKDCLEKLNIKYNYSGHEFIIHSKFLWEILFPLGNSYKKRIPSYLINADKNHLSVLYEALIKGDGSYYDTYECYYSVNKQLVEDVALLALLLGKSCSIYKRDEQYNSIMPHGKLQNQLAVKPQWVMRTRAANTHELRNSNFQKIINKTYYKGIVYCVTTEAGAIFVEREGKISVAGNCDFCLLHKDKQISWSMTEDLDNDKIPDWIEVANTFKKYGWTWGGDWTQFKDYPHVEKTFGLNINTALNLYNTRKVDSEGYILI